MSGAVRVCADGAALAEAAAELFAASARAAVAARGRFVVALSGGSTPQATYELLAAEPWRSRVPWPWVHVFWGDERCVPPNDERSNERMARQALLDHVPVVASQVHPIRCAGDPAAAAARYEEILKEYFSRNPDEDAGATPCPGGPYRRAGCVFGSTSCPRTAGGQGVAPPFDNSHTLSGGWPRFDLVLLGLGTNGHTASLFPGTAVLNEERRWVAEVYVAEERLHRVTLTAPAINAAALVAFLVSGREKADILRRVREGPRDTSNLPAQMIEPTDGELVWLVDRAAADG